MCGTHYQRVLRAEGSGVTRYPVTCAGCGEDFDSQRREGKYCSYACRSLVVRGQARGQTVCKLPVDHAVRVLIREAGVARSREYAQSQRSAFRLAVETSDYSVVLTEVRKRVVISTTGCWQWARRGQGGYPVHRFGNKTVLVHRLVVEAKHQAPLGKQAAHHTCANTMCVNPEHLQPVTARENTAEMLARTYMESRIADLEAALALLAPAHPLLAEVGIPVKVA